VLAAELQQARDPNAAAPQRGDELPGSDPVPIHAGWDFYPVRLTEGLDPHATAVVYVSGDHPDRPPGCSGHRSGPQAGGQVLEEEEGDAIVGPPGGEDRFAEIRRGRHCDSRRAHDCFVPFLSFVSFVPFVPFVPFVSFVPFVPFVSFVSFVSLCLCGP
jgi:hypothetical protein